MKEIKTCECCNSKKNLEDYRYKKKTYYLCASCGEDIGFLGLQELIDNR